MQGTRFHVPIADHGPKSPGHKTTAIVLQQMKRDEKSPSNYSIFRLESQWFLPLIRTNKKGAKMVS